MGIWSARETEALRALGFDLEGKGGRSCGFGTEVEGLHLRLVLERRYSILEPEVSIPCSVLK